jgi:mono/diheme cytochrome c family protein
MEEAGALDVRLVVIPPGEESAQAVRRAASLLLPFLMAGVLPACSQDMQEQPSYHAQEAPRRHSPLGSVPRESRQVVPIQTEPNQRPAAAGARLFDINCVHCHGAQGEGDGPVAAFLKERPANLRGEEVRTKSEEAIYRIITDGKDMMPAFQGELSAGERLQLARFVASLSRSSVAHGETAEER